VLRAGRRFQDEKRITITRLQSMVNTYRSYSRGGDLGDCSLL
jgi:type I restriction enzyme R subunit